MLIFKGEIPRLQKMSEKQLGKKMVIRDVAIVTRQEALDCVDDEMMRVYNIWRMWHLGFGMPLPGSWAQQPTYLMNIIEIIEGQYLRFKEKNK